MKKILGFVKREDGLVAIEWVGIAAVVLVAGITIAGALMTGANTAGQNVGNNAANLASEDPPSVDDVFPAAGGGDGGDGGGSL